MWFMKILFTLKTITCSEVYKYLWTCIFYSFIYLFNKKKIMTVKNMTDMSYLPWKIGPINGSAHEVGGILG